ncbi:MAG: hypothetical protein HQ564_09085 [Candidatus Saganbacteria bacterium]|nr:hypothetical protein [Candidatus Saganbacteria bacterium]
MCEHARLTIYSAFKNIQNRTKLKPLLMANGFFSSRLGKMVRSDPAFRGARVNIHRLEEVSADIIQKFGQAIQGESFDCESFEETLAAAILDNSFALSGVDISKKAVLRLIRTVVVDPKKRTLSMWLSDWSRSSDARFVHRSRTGAEQEEQGVCSAPEVELGVGAERVANGDDSTEPCG